MSSSDAPVVEKRKKEKKPFVPRKNKVFVRGVPPDTTDAEFEAVFSDIGPIKRCILIRDKVSRKCTGIGYVHFGLESDAAKAITIRNKHKLHGSALLLTEAKSREKVVRPPPVAPKVEGEEINVKDSDSSSSSSDSEDEKDDKKKQKKLPEKEKKEKKVEKVEKVKVKKEEPAASDSFIPLEHVPEKKSRPTGIILSKPAIASRTVVVSGVNNPGAWKTVLKKARTAGKVEAFEFPVADAPNTGHLLFPTVELALAAVAKFEKSDSDKSTLTAKLASTARLKQFRLIVRNLPWQTTEADIRKVFSPYGKIYEVNLPPGKKPGTCMGYGFVNMYNATDAQNAITNVHGKEINGRKVGVDFTLSKQKFAEEKAATPVKEEKADEMDVEVKDEEGSGSDNEDDEMDASDQEQTSGQEGDEAGSKADEDAGSDEDEDDEEDGEDDEEEEKEERKPQKSSDVHFGTTLFIRNIGYNTKEESIKERFARYGKLKYCLFVKSRQSGEFTGNAFVQFENKEDADKALSEAYRSSAYRLSKSHAASLRKDLESDIVIDGRALLVSKAVNRSEAGRMKDDYEKKRPKDPRNLALAQEGAIRTDSGDYQGLSSVEKQKVQSSNRSKNSKLINPNFHISRTRLCVRNLPKDVDEAKLRDIFKASVSHLGARNVHTGMHQVKIVRDTARDNRSRGFGFVEFKEHEAALEALHNLNNKPNKLAGGSRLLVEFAVENALVLQKREHKKLKEKELKSARAWQAAENGEKPEGQPQGQQNQNQGKSNPKKRGRQTEEVGEESEGSIGGGEQQNKRRKVSDHPDRPQAAKSGNPRPPKYQTEKKQQRKPTSEEPVALAGLSQKERRAFNLPKHKQQQWRKPKSNLASLEKMVKEQFGKSQ